MSTIDNHPLAAIGLDSISEESPCGENARYDSAFEQLEAELAKQESLTSETVDWGKVIELASAIIRNKSKDVLVGSYLCYGLLLQESYSGLAVGLKILNDMSSTHWDCLFPPAKRMRARQTAFSWLAEKAGLVLADKAPAADESAAVIDAADILKQLDNTLLEKMGDQAPLLTEISRPLKNYRQSAEAEQAKAQQPEPEAPPQNMPPPAEAQPSVAKSPQPPPAVVKPPAPPSPSQPASDSSSDVSQAIASGNIQTEADSKKILRQIQAASRDVSGFWMSQKLSDPRAYRLSRVAAWMVVENVPPANEGVTQINPPAAERIKFFETRMEKSEFASVVLELEKTVARAPFWLDGHFLVVKALRGLGAEYEAAIQTVIRETANFLSRLPELVELSFSDQTPFASDQTRLWLNAEVLSSAKSAGEGGSTAGEAGEAWVKGLAEASSKAAAGETGQAVEIMQKGLQQAGQLRDQMYWRCALAQLLMQLGEAESAANILEQVSIQIDETQLSVWEPKLLAHIYNLLFQSYSKQMKKNKDDISLKEKVTRAYEKLCWFDPVTALSVKGG